MFSETGTRFLEYTGIILIKLRATGMICILRTCPEISVYSQVVDM